MGLRVTGHFLREGAGTGSGLRAFVLRDMETRASASSRSRSRSSSVPGFVPVPVLVLVFVLEVVPVLVERMGTGCGDGTPSHNRR